MALFKGFPIYGITSEKNSLGRSNYQVVKAMLEAGIRFVQYREKEKSGLARYEECLELRKLTREYGAALIIDDFVDLAMAVEADGIHVGQDDLPVEIVRQLVGKDMVIGLSTHSPTQLEAANKLKDIIDYVGVGPVFATQTKATAEPVGFSYVEYAAKNSSVPFVAIGGIKAQNIFHVWEHGARNMAVVTEITQAEDIEQKIQKLLNIIKR
ncbi:thiamine phosphate synthase [Anaerovibrio sp. JC8]|uniref:thiamine phosphate synthase n=1 Tax=Anaerovibrio sp. JC8 TaxID=1240085 RepID=UPI001E58A92E|nr:thiamine phosphate synthase [Anaerovibrio sp. JC8]